MSPGTSASFFAALLLLSAAACSPDDEEPAERALDEDFPSALDTTDTVSDRDTVDTGAVGADTGTVGPDTDEPAGPPAGEGAPPPRDRPAQTAPPPSDGTDAAPRAGEGGMETHEGRVAVTGAVPTTFLTLQWEGGSVVLRGDLSDELRRLAGATVRVTGTPTEQGPDRALRVVNYEILEIDGARPSVGVLMREEDGMHLHDESGRMFPLAGAPASMQRRVGAKVWIVGPLEDGALRVRSYGVIRPEG